MDAATAKAESAINSSNFKGSVITDFPNSSHVDVQLQQ
jgi:hypothetical protein